MNSRIHRSVSCRVRTGLSWEQLWQGADRGLFLNWELGRERASREPDVAEQARSGELPPSHWKGGIDKRKPPKAKTKRYAPLSYLAEWQGLRGEDLDIDPNEEVELECSATGIRVTFTSDRGKYS